MKRAFAARFALHRGPPAKAGTTKRSGFPGRRDGKRLPRRKKAAPPSAAEAFHTPLPRRFIVGRVAGRDENRGRRVRSRTGLVAQAEHLGATVHRPHGGPVRACRRQWSGRARRRPAQSVSVHMRQPVFGTDPEQLAKALRDAVAEARSKAQVLAMGCGLTLGPVLNVEEEDPSSGHPVSWATKTGLAGASPSVGVLAAAGARSRNPWGRPRRTVTVNVPGALRHRFIPPRTASRNAN